MFKDRSFKISFFFSAAMHLVCLSAVCIVTVPAARFNNTNSQTEINFLGPILEKTAFEIMAEDFTPCAETYYTANRDFMNEDIDAGVKKPERIVGKDMPRDKALAGREPPEKGNIAVEKDIRGRAIDGRNIFYHVTDKASNRLIEGPAKKRTVLFRPDFPRICKQAFVDEKNFTAKFKFVLSDSGTVEMVEPIVSCGYPAIDMKCVKNLKEWKFSPRQVKTGEKDWGEITLFIGLE